MKKYRLANTEKRNQVDLRNHQAIITEAVAEVIPHAIVTVEKDYYSVTPPPTKGEAISIGRKICKSDLHCYCIFISKLFCSDDFEPIDEED